MGGGGSGGPVGDAAQMAADAKTSAPVPYTPPVQNGKYQSQYAPMQRGTNALPQYQFSGLQQLYSMFNSPAAQQMRSMPQYSRPLYNPNMENAQQALGRVNPSVALERQRAAEAEAKRLAEQAAWDAEHPQAQDNNYGGGG